MKVLQKVKENIKPNDRVLKVINANENYMRYAHGNPVSGLPTPLVSLLKS